MRKILLLNLLFATSLLVNGQSALKTKINTAADAIQGKVVTWRRDFHQTPELSNREFKTAEKIAAHLRSLGIEVQEKVAFTGVVGILKGGKPGPVVALRADIDGSLRSRLRLQERQFESMVNIWGVLKNAQEKLGVLLSPLQSYSDIRRMDAEARQEYMQSFDLQEWQRKEILASGDVQKSFSSMIDRKRFNEAAIAFNVYDKATRANEIFFSEEIFTKLRSIADCMHSALVDKELSLDDADRALSQSAWKTFEKDCIPKVGEFASFARKLLSETEQASKQ